MIFKRKELEAEYAELSPALKEMVEYFCKVSHFFSVEPVVTRIFEKIDGSSGVHEDRRAIDFRDETIGPHNVRHFLYIVSARRALLESVNELFQRKDGKKSLIWHSFRGMPHHFHLQIEKWKDTESRQALHGQLSTQGSSEVAHKPVSES